MPDKILFKNKLILTVSFIALFFCMGLQFYFLFKNAVDLPWWDEWEYLKSNALVSQTPISFLFSFFGEERIFFPRFYTLILLYFDSWNVRHQILINWFIYSSALFVLFKILWKTTKGFSFLPLFFVFLYTNFSAHNALFGFSIQYYFILLFSFLAVYFGYIKENTPKNTVLFSIFSLCSMFSMTFLSGIGLLVPYLIKERKNKQNCIIASSIILIGLMLFFILPSQSNFTSQYKVTLPFTLKYWLYFSTFVFSAILNTLFKISFLFPTLLLISLIYIILPFFKENFTERKEYYTICAFIFLAFTLLSGIVAGRSTTYGIESRHFVVINWLIPVFASIFIIQKHNILLTIYFCFISCFCINNMNYFDYYVVNENREVSKEILASKLYEDKIIIKELYIDEITQEMLRNAKKLNCSWYNDLVLLNTKQKQLYEKK